MSRVPGPPWAAVRVAPGVLVATSRRFATTSAVVLDGSGGALVVDPAWEADELAGLAALLAARGLRCRAGLATHGHYDHVLWHPGLGDAPRWASPRTAALVRDRRGEVLDPLRDDLPDALLGLAGRLVALPPAAGPGRELPWSGPVVLLHEHDAHAPGHLAAEIVEAGVLLAGDMLSDEELPMPADEDAGLEPYLRGLEVLAPAVARCSVLVPGHGRPTTAPRERLDADRRYLDDLLAGRTSRDERIGRPGMGELHAANLARARGEWPSPGGEPAQP